MDARICQVHFFNTKWQLPEAKPIDDSFVQHYWSKMGAMELVEDNIFDYGVAFLEEQQECYDVSGEQISWAENQNLKLHFKES